MRRRWGWILAVVAAAIISAAGGTYFGFSLGVRTILNDALYKDALDVESSMTGLKALRTGDREQAIETLEAHMDDVLIRFDPVEPYRGLNSQTTAEIDKALHEAADYRAANLRKSKRAYVDAMVSNLLSRVKR